MARRGTDGVVCYGNGPRPHCSPFKQNSLSKWQPRTRSLSKITLWAYGWPYHPPLTHAYAFRPVQHILSHAMPTWECFTWILHTSASVARSGCAHRPERGQHREEAVGCRRLLRECARCVHARRRAARVARAGRFAWPSPAARAPQWDASTPRAPRGAARRGPFGGGWSRRLRRGGGAPCTAGR